MKQFKTDLDPRIAAALRADMPPDVDSSRLSVLASRIARTARPLLDERRLGPRERLWWNFAAGWAGTLIPAGMTVAVASAAVLWFARPVGSSPVVGPTANTPAVILGAASGAPPQPDLIDQAVEEIIRPPRAGRPRGGR